jgi:hypothetical protein
MTGYSPDSIFEKGSWKIIGCFSKKFIDQSGKFDKNPEIWVDESTNFSMDFKTLKRWRNLKSKFLILKRIVLTKVKVLTRWSDTFSLSRPLLRLMYGEYWFRLSRLSMMVIGSLTSYTMTKSVESAVWCLLTQDDDDVEQVAGSKYLNMVQDQNCSFLLWTTTSKILWKWKQNE